MEKKILLVDDEEGIRKVLGISLADSGYEVLTAENGEQALQLFRDNRPPIVMTDIKMPGMDGISLLQKIKSERPDTEVIMITGHGDMDLAIKSLQLEAIDFVTKPINDDILQIALNRAAEKITMREQLRQYTENLETLIEEQSAKLVEAERLAAVGQAIEGLSTAIKGIAGDLEGGIRYFNEMPCFVSIHNRELKIVETNQLFKQRLGDGIGSNSWDIYTQAGENSEDCPVGRTFQMGTGQRGREIVHFPDGRQLPVMVHTAPIQGKGGELELVLEIAADISEVQRLQEQLRTTEQRYQQLFDEVPCYISVQDKDLRLTATNRRFKEDFGERTHSHCFEVYKSRDEACPNCPVTKTFSDGKSHQSEMVVTSAHGEQYNVLIWTAPIRNAAGEVIQVMEMMTNITQIRQLQDHLTSLGFLISSISHGIKGLLTGLDGGMYLINTGIEKNESGKIKEGWDVVQLMTDRIRSLVQNILFYAKERQLHIEKVDVLGFAEDLCMTMVPKIDAHDIEFTKHFEPSLGSFEVDANVVRTALINILENALEAVAVDTVEMRHRISLEVHRDKKAVVFDIRDNGVGMDPETLGNLFTLFFSTKGHAGTGLGLYIAEKVIQQHGGKIEVESKAGEGSRFQVFLPASLPPSIRKTLKTTAPATTSE